MAQTEKFDLKFDPKTIEHLGMKMYSTLPPALAELIANSYDADASEARLIFREKDGRPDSIELEDDGEGMTVDDIQERFLIIGRNRRKEDGDEARGIHQRLPIGKKGLGKLALFGLAKTITIRTRREGRETEFELDWGNLISSSGVYSPKTISFNKETNERNGTEIRLFNLKRVSPFDTETLADSLSRLFIVDASFKIILESPDGKTFVVDDARRYSQLTKQFEWDAATLVPTGSPYEGRIVGKLYTAETPIPPSSGLRGITLFSRGKMVNAPEYFSASTSSHFFQYLTGWLSVDFIDLIEEDVISTHRQAISLEHEEMSKLREFLSEMVASVNKEWRGKRKDLKDDELHKATGIDTQKWLATLPEDVREHTNKIVDALGGEDALQTFTPVIKALHKIIPEYPLLHWRHLHGALRDRIRSHYESHQYGQAADEGTKIYCELIRKMTGLDKDGTELTGSSFGGTSPRIKVADLSAETGRNIQEGQEALSRGLLKGFRNPISHAPMDSVVPGTFSELDCLNILSLISYLLARVDNAQVDPVPN